MRDGIWLGMYSASEIDRETFEWRAKNANVCEDAATSSNDSGRVTNTHDDEGIAMTETCYPMVETAEILGPSFARVADFLASAQIDCIRTGRLRRVPADVIATYVMPSSESLGRSHRGWDNTNCWGANSAPRIAISEVTFNAELHQPGRPIRTCPATRSCSPARCARRRTGARTAHDTTLGSSKLAETL